MKLGVIMDPIAGINYKKDTTLAMLLAAQARDWELYYMEMNDLAFPADVPRASYRRLKVMADPEQWYEFTDSGEIALAELDVILMRKDPPFDMEYIYATYLLEYVAAAGTLVVNNPTGLRSVNEKFFIKHFPECIAPTLITRDARRIREFIAEQQQIVLKPLHGMGGESIFRVDANEGNINVIIETITQNGSRYVMAQKYLPDIADGDKRIMLINGEPLDYALARIPAPGETRANLVAGGSGEGRELSDRDRRICQQVGPVLKKMGLLFAGLDVIGDYLTEINVTSPTGVRELDRIYQLDISGKLMDVIVTTRVES
ncbi:MAG: glutathione synthase [Gammaproteobacteria bacterium]